MDAAANRPGDASDCGPIQLPPSVREIWRKPLPLLERSGSRLLARVLISVFGGRVREIHGLENIAPERDPFILLPNHNQRLEALLVPTLLIYHRDGRLLHFLGDWNFFLIPIVASFYRRSGVIVVTRKDARPRFLNVFKRFFAEELTAMERAALKLREGGSVGIFPEGTMNRNPREMRRGSPGAARLSIETGVPIVPMGISFPENDGRSPIRDLEAMQLNIGAALEPPLCTLGERAPAAAVRSWHDRVMVELSRLSGKSWPPGN